MKARRALLIGCTTAGALLGAACAPLRAPAPSTPQAPVGGVPRTILMRGERLAEARRELASGGGALKPTFDALLDSARAALAAAPLSVMQKRNTPSSGDKHDFMSMAPYWWPDTTKPGGVPFIRRDGQVYPESRVDHDGVRLQKTIGRVQALSLAWYLTGEERYAQGASRLLRVFFLDTATHMNPNLRFAQAVLGVTEGRGIGIIDTRNMPQLVDALRLLDGAPGWTAGDRDGMVAWCRSYLAWMLESANGTEERAATNNHGTFYDEQVVALALFVGDTATARKTLHESATSRIAAQIDATGRQPEELARTRPLHYSLFNLDAFTMLAEMGRHVGVDLWRYEAPGGGSIPRALASVAPYADRTVKFPLPETGADPRAAFLPPMRRAAAVLGDVRFTAALLQLPASQRAVDFDQFNFPDPPAAPSMSTAALLERALDRAGEQLRRTASTLNPAKGYPRSTDAAGNWTQSAASQWTSGFFAGTLWYMYQRDGRAEWRALAERWMTALEANKTRTNTHDLGFILFDSFGHGYLLTGNAQYRDVVMQASRSLATRFNPTVGAIQSWDTFGGQDARKAWKYPVIVDNLMNLEMLSWAGAHGGDTSWARIAERHALTSARAHVRADGSTAHVALFDPATGALERTVTWQGFADSSTWARGQAWAIHGLSASYGRTRRPELLSAAQRAADWFIAHMPADGVPYWDFRHPAIPNAERDASAAAIAASGLYDLARHSAAPAAARYRAAAERMLVSLATDYTAPETASGAILAHSTGGRPQGVEIDVGLVYADYFFVEALLRRGGKFLP